MDLVTGKDYQTLRQEALDRVPDIYDKRDTQPIPSAISPAAYIAEGIYIDMNEVQKQQNPLTAYGDGLNPWAMVANTYRYPASAAVRLGIFNIPVPTGSRFSTINGTESIDFTVTASAGMSEDNQYQYQLTADTPGTIGNDYSGPILPITAIQGLTCAQITDILVPGDDTETDDEYRDRIVTLLNDKPFGGNIAAYREEIGKIDGVGAVQVYPTWNGGGTVKCSILGADFLPAPETLVENVQNAIDPPINQGLGLGMAPIGAKVTIVAPTSVTINVSATLTLASGYAIGQVQEPVEQALENYLLSIRQEWATNVSATAVEYAANIYVSNVVAALVNTPGIVNATNVQLNGGTSDLFLTETGVTQQVPVLGEVTLT